MGELFRYFKSLTFSVYYGNQDVVIDPFMLQKNILETSGLFKQDSQEDAHEFMTYIIDQIAED
jgi:uncharacterized UBP type Zn finger protein